MQKFFFRSLFLLLALNLLVKPLWIFAIDRQVQVITGYEVYGKYFALLNLSMVFSFLADLGITFYFNQKAAAEINKAPVLFLQSLAVKFFLSLVYTGVVFTAALISKVSDMRLLGLLAILQLAVSFLLLLRAKLTANQLFHFDAFVSVTDKLFVIIAAGLMIYFPGFAGPISIYSFVYVQIAGVAIALLLSVFFLFRTRSVNARRKIKLKESLRQVFKASLPFALNVFFMTVLMRGDSFLLERMHTDGAGEAGIYAAAYRLLDAVNMVGFLFAGFLLPYIARHQWEKERIQSTILACRHMLCLGFITISALCFAIPGSVNRLLYQQTDSYSASIIALTILALPGLALAHVYGTVLTATGNIRQFLNITLVFTGLSLLFNILFIRQWGAAACSSIAAVMQLIYGLVLMYAATGKTRIKAELKLLLACCFIGLLCWGIMKIVQYYHWNEAAAVFIMAGAVIVYALVSRRLGLKEVLQMITEK